MRNPKSDCKAETTREMGHRVTLRFQSDRGNEYLFDDVTGSILPWSDVSEAVLRLKLANTYDEQKDALTAIYGDSEVDASHRLIEHWRQNYGAFVRNWSDEDWLDFPSEDLLREQIRSRSFELLLILTENCNLRCQYCALSDTYPLNRVRTPRKMTFDTARRAVDWYASFVEPQMAQNPRKRFGLSFYGGEPMMNLPVLEEVLDYCRDIYPDTFLPVMTTNGTLLTPKNVKALVEHNVQLAISIDGPAEEHDRLRIDQRRRGTFSRIVKNLRRMKKDHPDYWATNVTSVSVYDYGTNLEEVESFFAEHEESMPRSVFVNRVGEYNTDWYSRYSDDDRERTATALGQLARRYREAKVEGRPTSHYMNCAVGMGVIHILLRRRAQDHRPSILPFSGACIPGDKIAVHVDGKIDMCERVNGTYPIGHMDTGGIDFKALGKIVDRYRQKVLFNCPQCPASKLCGLCFTFVEGEADFSQDWGLCKSSLEGARRNLSDYVSIMEANPQADFGFETDTSRLEERMLHKY